jgi:PsbN protein
MNLDTALIAIGIASLTIGLTVLTIYSSFGPGSENLIDPFEEDDD